MLEQNVSLNIRTKLPTATEAEIQSVVVSWEEKCECPCHNEPGIMHIVACCNNGIIKRSASFLATELIALAQNINKIKFGFIKTSH